MVQIQLLVVISIPGVIRLNWLSILVGLKLGSAEAKTVFRSEAVSTATIALGAPGTYVVIILLVFILVDCSVRVTVEAVVCNLV